MLVNLNYQVAGHVKIFDPISGEIFCEKKNAINYENMSQALANNVANKLQMGMSEMSFGNGGTTINETGIITYLPTNTASASGDLYNQTYYKIIDNNNTGNLDAARNHIIVSHIPGNTYTDVILTCLLDYGEPSGQAAFDNTNNVDGTYVFDELGIRASGTAGPNTGPLLTHVVFHPIQKALNRLIQIEYTIRISSITSIITTA